MLQDKYCCYTLAAVIVLSCLADASGVVCSVERAREHIVATLRKENPSLVAEFKAFCMQYDALVIAFFDTKNYDSLPIHIKYMEAALNTLGSVCCDVRYHKVRPILNFYHKRIAELVGVLNKHIGYHNALLLSFKVRKFKPLLPECVRLRGDFALFCALRHRLACG